RALVRWTGRGQPDEHGRLVVEDEALLGRGDGAALDGGRWKDRVRLQQRRRLGRRDGTGLPISFDGADEFRLPRLRRDRLRGEENDVALRRGLREGASRGGSSGGVSPAGPASRGMDS